MSEAPRKLAAVHYYYLLKGDREDLLRLWSILTADAGGGDSGDLPLLRLASAFEEPATPRCQVFHRVEGAEAGFCLCVLADMSVIEVNYWSRHDTLAEDWRRAIEAIESDRDRLLSEVNGVFGETTLLAAPAGTVLETMLAAADIATDPVLVTHIKREIAAEEPARLVHFPRQSGDGRDYYALAAADPAAFTTAAFPEMDSLIKKLGHTAIYFEQQRQSIISERSVVDHEIGALLHRQVVTDAGGAAGAASLEEQITTLSRLFGLLATDALLIRQSSDGLSRDIKLLNRELKQITEPGFADEIGAHYMNRFSLDLAETHDESRNLDFSRQNAQAAIEVVRTQVEIMRAGEEAAIQQQSQEILSRSLVLQKERLALQVAAVFVEFVLVFYCVLKSWEGVAGASPVEHVPPLVRLAVVGGFSASAAVGTHYLAHALQYRSWKSTGLWLSVSLLVLSLVAMAILSIAYQ